MKKSLSLILTVILILACAPLSALAAGPKSITNITVTGPTVWEGTDGWFYDEYDPITGLYLGSYFMYDVTPAAVTISFADGTTETVTTGSECYSATGYWWEFSSDQSFYNPWDIGYHTATVKIGNKSASYTVTVQPLTIKGVEVEDITLIEGIDGYDAFEMNRQTGSFQNYFRYTFWGAKVYVILGDGTKQEIYSGYEDHDKWGNLFFADGQNPAEPWGVGPHKARAYLLGKWCEFTVTVVENPVESVEFHDVTVMRRINSTVEPGFRYYQYYPDYTVTFKDGTTQRSERGYVYWNGTLIPVQNNDDQFTNHWMAENEFGDHYIDIAVGGVWGVQKVTVVDNHYSRMSVRQDDDINLILQFWKSSVDYDEYKAENFVYSGTDGEGWLVAQIDVGGNPARARFHFSHDITGTLPYYEYEFIASIGEGDYESEKHDYDILWLKKEIMLPRYAGYTFVAPYYDPSFNGFSQSAYNVDVIIPLAVNMRGLFEKYESMGWDGEFSYAFFTDHEVIDSVLYVFGVDITDRLTEYKYYDEAMPDVLRVNCSGRTDYVKDLGFDPKPDNAGWRYMNTLYERNDGSQEMYRFRLAQNLSISAIFYLGPVGQYDVGDVDGDGSVNMKDVLFLRKVIAGAETLTEEQAKRADVNGDGEVNMKDVLALRKIIAGAA